MPQTRLISVKPLTEKVISAANQLLKIELITAQNETWLFIY